MKTQVKQLDYQRLREDAEKNAAPEPRFVRVIEDWQNVRQGDLLLIRVPADLMKRSKRHTSAQLAPGSTQGSRHVAEAPAAVYAPEGGNAAVLAKHGYDKRVCLPQLIGPVFESGERFSVSHPEHAHINLPSGCYIAVHQRDYESEAIRAVTD